MDWRTVIAYTLKRIVRQGPSAIKGVVYLALVAAALVAFAVLMPSLEYQHAEAYRLSRHDLWVSGPLTEADVSRFEAMPQVGDVVSFLTLSVQDIRGPRTDESDSIAAGAVTAVVYDSASDLDVGPYPEGLAVRGTPPSDGELACDWNTARRLDLSPGDHVQAVALIDGDRIPISGTLACVYGPSGMARDTLAVPMSQSLVEAAASTGGGRWSDAFMACEEPARIAASLSEGADADRLLAVPAIDLATEARRRMLSEVGPFLRSGATWVAVIALVILAFWQRSTRLSVRKREYAILAAVGVSSRGLARLDAMEQVLHLGLALSIGLLSAIWVVQTLGGLFVPPSAISSAATVLIATVVLTLLAGGVLAKLSLRPHSLADTLAEEA